MNGRISFILLFLLNIFLLVNSYSYLSTEEAFLLRDHTLCLGNCIENNGTSKCVYDWGAHEAECTATKIKTKNYRTKSGRTCLSNCGKFGETYEWCACHINGKLSRDECATLQVTRAKLTYQTNNQWLTCQDECSNRTFARPRCNTVRGWQYCDPDNKVILFGRITNSHILCASPCSLYNNEPYCYDADGGWSRCYLNQDNDKKMSELSKYLENHWDHGEYTQAGYKQCTKPKKKDLEYPDPGEVEHLARLYENLYSTVIMRTIDLKNPDPTIQFTVFDTINKFDEDQLVIPLVYRGVITNHTLRKSENKDPDWPAKIKSNYGRLNPIVEGTNKDNKGHLLSPTLGGPTERYNIFPQSISSVIGNFSRFHYLEADITNFIDRHPESYVQYAAVLSYDLTTETPYRPTAIGLSIRLYNKDNVLYDTKGIFVSDRDYTLMNMFFSNDPKFNCTIV